MAINKYYPDLQIHADTGYIYSDSINPKTNLYDRSNQSDIIITIGKGKSKKLTTSDKRVHFKDLVAVIEVKKDFKAKNIFAESIWNTLSVSNFLDYCTIFNRFSFISEQVRTGIFPELQIDSQKPSVIFGFSGSKQEATRRKQFVELLENKLTYKKPSKKEIAIQCNHLYQLPELIIDDNNAIIKMTGPFQAFSDKILSLISTCGHLTTELKIYIFKLTILYAVIRHLNNQELAQEIAKNSNKLLLITNSLFVFDMTDGRYKIVTDKYLWKPIFEYENMIKLSETESKIYFDIKLRKIKYKIQIEVSLLEKFLSNKLIITNEDEIIINEATYVDASTNELIIYIGKTPFQQFS